MGDSCSAGRVKSLDPSLTRRPCGDSAAEGAAARPIAAMASA